MSPPGSRVYKALVEIAARMGAPHEVLPGDEGVSGVRTTVSVLSAGAGEGDEEHEWVQTGARVRRRGYNLPKTDFAALRWGTWERTTRV